jgi:hypothetical protein
MWGETWVIKNSTWNDWDLDKATKLQHLTSAMVMNPGHERKTAGSSMKLPQDGWQQGGKMESDASYSFSGSASAIASTWRTKWERGGRAKLGGTRNKA